MSELPPKKWEKYDECGGCDSAYVMDGSNSVLFVFNKQPEINRLYSTCTFCDHRALFFMNEEKADLATDGGVPTYTIDGIAPEDIFKGYLRHVLGLEPPESHAIGHHAELHVKYLGNLLLTDHLTPDDFNGEGELLI